MRVSVGSRRVEVVPGQPANVVLDVVNTDAVIDGVVARVVGIDPSYVLSSPRQLPLFPDSEGRLTLTLSLPLTFPAGRTPVVVEVGSTVVQDNVQRIDLDLVVAPREGLVLGVTPDVRRVRRRAKFAVSCTNTGNVPADVHLAGLDTTRTVTTSFSPAAFVLAPGARANTVLTARADRHVFGGDLDRPLMVAAIAGEATAQHVVTLRQRPMVPRGSVTMLVLAGIVGLWAAAFLLGLTQVYGGDPLTKTAPASFFLSSQSDDKALVAAVLTEDLLSKKAALGPGVGGSVTGRVVAASSRQGVGRVVVEALRASASGPVLMTSAATDSDGAYRLVGLFPGRYLLRFTANGFRDVWYPAAGSSGGARPVAVSAAAATGGIDVTITGRPATLSGSVDLGDVVKPVPVKVVARPLLSSGPGRAFTTTAAADGSYVLRGLPAPATYEVVATAAGYRPGTLADHLGAGQSRTEPTIRLVAGPGTVTGRVTDGRNPLGAVTVTTTVAGKAVTTTTPTLGAVGAFTLPGLPTPATYLVTFAKEGYGARTLVIALAPGQQRADLQVALVAGTGAVSGKVLDDAGVALGGVTVSVGGGPSSVTTTTLTEGAVGSFALSALPTPGAYTLTFTLPGYGSQTVPVTLAEDAAAHVVEVRLSRDAGRLTGRILGPGGVPLPGAKVEVTDGATVRATVAVSTPVAGAWTVADLPAGTYTVTASRPGYRSRTALVTVKAGAPTTQDLTLVLDGG